MIVRKVGFFIELSPYGNRNLPSIRSAIRINPHPNEEQIIRYLAAGKDIIYRGGPVHDVLAKDWTLVGRHGISVTDGTWLWPVELAYYVRQYHIALPEEFIMHMKSQQWPASFDVDWSDVQVE